MIPLPPPQEKLPSKSPALLGLSIRICGIRMLKREQIWVASFKMNHNLSLSQNVCTSQVIKNIKSKSYLCIKITFLWKSLQKNTLSVLLRKLFFLTTSRMQSSNNCEHTTQRKIEMSILLIWTSRSSRPEVFRKKGVLKNFTKFTGKHLYQSFFNKVTGLDLMNFVRFLRTPIFIEHLWWLLLNIVNAFY